MGRGTSGTVAAPASEGVTGAADDDAKLVARVRRGDDRAFEALYERYHRRIHAYVLGMVKDHGRAEDVTQEAFLSALRRMRETEQPLAFKAWLYQIAKNGCIDAFRRSQRAEEVSYDAEGALAPGDHSKLVASGASPDAAVATKLELDNLCGAFGGLSETHHEILVLRELEGLSYAEIGDRMGMSRPAVESTLFRARRRLSEEYDDIVTGARCERIQGIIVAAVQSRLGLRDTRRLARHLSHCQPCRREALAAGVDRALFDRPTVRERLAGKVAGLLPFPIFAKLRKGAEGAAPPPSGRTASLLQQLPLLSEAGQSGWGKAAAGAAVIVAGVGAGVGVQQATTTVAPPPPAVAQATAEPGRTAAAAPRTERPTATASATTRAAVTRPAAREAVQPQREERLASTRHKPTRTASRPVAERPAPAPTAERAPARPVAASGGGSSTGSSPARSKAPAETKPPAPAPTATPAAPKAPVQETVQQTTTAVQQTTSQVTQGLNNTVQATTGTVDTVVETVTGGGPVADTVNKTTDVVDGVVGGLGRTVDQVAGGLGQTVDGLAGALKPRPRG